MTLSWEELNVIEDDIETTPCDCCGTSTVQVNGDIEKENGDWIAFYWVRFSKGHPDVFPVFHFGTGDWSESASSQNRWVFAMEFCRESEGCRVIDFPQDGRLTSATCLSRNDLLSTDFASDAFAMFDAVIMKDTRLMELKR